MKRRGAGALRRERERGSGLQNLGDGCYQYHWKTPSTYAASRTVLKLDLGEAEPRQPCFSLTR